MRKEGAAGSTAARGITVARSGAKLTVDRGLQLRIAPDGTRTLLVRYTIKGTTGERQHRLSQDYGGSAGQIRLAAACAEAAGIHALARDGVDCGQLKKRPACMPKL